MVSAAAGLPQPQAAVPVAQRGATGAQQRVLAGGGRGRAGGHGRLQPGRPAHQAEEAHRGPVPLRQYSRLQRLSALSALSAASYSHGTVKYYICFGGALPQKQGGSNTSFEMFGARSEDSVEMRFRASFIILCSSQNVPPKILKLVLLHPCFGGKGSPKQVLFFICFHSEGAVAGEGAAAQAA